MKSKKRDIFLVSHARRMKQCRKRQQEQDPEAYRDRVNNQKRQYRLNMSSAVLTDQQTAQKQRSILKTRKANRRRQRRYRLNQSEKTKCLYREKNRCSKRLKRQQKPFNRAHNHHQTPPLSSFCIFDIVEL